MPEALLAGLFGLLIGSFLNVCIHRWPRDLSVVRPRSACPGCSRQIDWYDNIPVLSFIVLRARCRHCQIPISWRYPLVEALTGVAFFWFTASLGLNLMAAKYCIFAAILIGLVFSDLETLLLPDEFTLGGFVIGIALAPFVRVPDATFTMLAGIMGFTLGSRSASIGEALFGALVPAGSLWLLGWTFEKLRHKQGLGFGDVKMIAMIGAFLGIGGTLLTVVLASILGSVTGLIYIKATSKDASTYQLPFGTFLGAAALLAAIIGERVLNWYGNLLR
jgi:leader peptidase (prepilin peptidase)/N-methyltransferase